MCRVVKIEWRIDFEYRNVVIVVLIVIFFVIREFRYIVNNSTEIVSVRSATDAERN